MTNPIEVTDTLQSKALFDALTCAVVLDPSGVSRNRHFEWYISAWSKQAHLRAHRLHRLARTLIQFRPTKRGETSVLQVGSMDSARSISYSYENLSIKRTVLLDSLEVSLMRWLLWQKRKPTRKMHEQLVRHFSLHSDDIERMETALVLLRNLPGVPWISQALERLQAFDISQQHEATDGKHS